MVYRLTWLGIVGGIVAALIRMEQLLRPAENGPAWQLVLIAALLLGGVITWVARSYRLSAASVIGLNLAGMLLATIRIAAPDTAFLGVLPTLGTVTETGRELEFAVGMIQYGIAPVLPVAGLILILTWLFWVIGIMIVWALHAGRPAFAVVPGIVLYLQLATMDRGPTDTWATIGYLAIVVGTLAGIAHDERTVGTGRVRDAQRRFVRGGTALVPVALAAAVLAVGVGMTLFVTNQVPTAGFLNWRSTGFGNGLFGGASFNHFVGIRQQLVSLSTEPVFTATVRGSVDEEELYWKLLALEEFDGTNWFPRQTGAQPQGSDQWEISDQRFFGPETEITSDVTIASLDMPFLPAPYSPIGINSNFELLLDLYHVKTDGSIKFDNRTYAGLEYQVISQVPQPDLAVLASSGGQPSPLFAKAARAGLFTPRSDPTAPETRTFAERTELVDTSGLSTDDQLLLHEFAKVVTSEATTDFEQAVLLEAFFRNPDEFTYNAQVGTGHSAENIVDWLLLSDSPNYREGYCEQFAASMAVMARTLDVPARVILGFAPGEKAADGIVTVRENDAHAWVELYFETQGWVRFDPTPRNAGDNPATSSGLGFDPTEFSGSAEGQPGGAEPDDPFAAPNFDLDAFRRQLEGDIPTGSAPASAPGSTGVEIDRRWFLVILITIPIAFSPILRNRRAKKRLLALKNGDVSAAWYEIVDRLSDLGDPVDASATPTEAAAAVTPLMVPLALAYQAQIYGDNVVPPQLVAGAEDSYEQTHRHLKENYTAIRQLFGWLRPGSLRRRDRS